MCTIDGCGPKSQMPVIEVSETDRRAFIAGAISLPLATILTYPDLAHAQASRLTGVTVPTPTGGTASGVIAMPTRLPAPAVVLIHEWWGLNDQIKAITAEFAKRGHIALAIDLYDGKVATTGSGARRLIQKMNTARAAERLATAIRYLRELNGSNGKVGTVGWCFGGGWSLNASIAEPVDATIIYYGRVNQPASSLRNLSGPVMGHFGTRDTSINAAMVNGFADEMRKAGKGDDLTVHWYDAHHAFANPTGARYDQADADMAWRRTLEFYAKNLHA